MSFTENQLISQYPELLVYKLINEYKDRGVNMSVIAYHGDPDNYFKAQYWLVKIDIEGFINYGVISKSSSNHDLFIADHLFRPTDIKLNTAIYKKIAIKRFLDLCNLK